MWYWESEFVMRSEIESETDECRLNLDRKLKGLKTEFESETETNLD